MWPCGISQGGSTASNILCCDRRALIAIDRPALRADNSEDCVRSFLFACHDFTLLMLIARDALVMARGLIVESAPVAQLVGDPQHDFTKKLLASTPTLN